MSCQLCGEPILEHERVEQPDFHRECAFRAVAGSVAHIERRCSCFVRGSDESDPPGVSKREAARMALEAWRKQNPGGSTTNGSH
jgi:hypothetical protein